ncbi:MAG: SMP-30/gluconolactonase/LRE family protein [Spirochaetota bacterium]
MAETDVRCVADTGNMLGEGPVYLPEENALYWVDILGNMIFRLGCDDESVRQYRFPCMPGALIPATYDGAFALFLVAAEDGIYAWKNGSYKHLFSVEKDQTENRSNDGCADPYGNLWFGTMDRNIKNAAGRYYCCRPDGRLRILDRHFEVTNGPAFDSSGTYIYLVDTTRRTVLRGELSEDGTVTGLADWLHTPEDSGFPDGPVMDSDDHMWIAFWQGRCIKRFTPDAVHELTVVLPASQVTKCAFGGKDFSTIYSTTARVGLSENELAERPCSGGLFACTVPGIRGRAPFSFHLTPMFIRNYSLDGFLRE